MSTKLRQYRGMLSAEQIAEGINAAIDNARMLSKAAHTLYEASQAAPATALSILSIEESGKTSILHQLGLAADENEARACWKSYRSHTSKNATCILGQLVAKGARKLHQLDELFNPTSDHPSVLDNLKQLCLYTDCLGKGRWSRPHEVSLDSLPQYLLTMVEMLSSAEHVTPIEVELWRKHMYPVKSGSLEANKRALMDWYRDLEQHGISKAKEADLAAFISMSSAPTAE